jgi:hypothetical protein
MPWQKYVADVATEVDADGRFCYKLVEVTVPRQSGKSLLDGVAMAHRALIVPAGRVWFTMQTGKDSVDWLLNEFWPLLGALGAEVHLRRAAGSEHIKWHRSGGLVRPFPPNETGLHSKVSDLVVVDECWAFDQMQGQAIDMGVVPTQATRPNAQTWKVSTAGTARSLWWLGTVEAGRAAVNAGRDSGVAYFEWSCPDELDPCAPSSWPVYHPAYGRTIGPESMQAALDQLGPDEFARAYGNRWVSTAARVIPAEAWRVAAEEPADMPAGAVAVGFDAAVDRSDGAIVVAWRDEGGIAHLEVADQRPGTGWMVDRLEEIVARWAPVAVAFDEAGPVLDLADAARRADLDVVGLKAREYAGACSGLLEALCAEPPTVRYRPHPALDAAALAAVRRPLGDAWAWGRRQSAGSIAALTAATVALWALDHAPAALGDFHIL